MPDPALAVKSALKGALSLLPITSDKVNRQALLAAERLLMSRKLQHRECRLLELSKTTRSIRARQWYESSNTGVEALRPESTKLYILGSGPSINSLSDDAWSEIREHDSWGFNRWWNHDFVPTGYVAQASGVEDIDREMADTFLKRSDDYADCKIVVRGDKVNDLSFHKSPIGLAIQQELSTVQVISELYFQSWCSARATRLVDQLYSQGFLGPEPNPLPVPKMGATIPLLLAMAIRLRYRQIVLCGVDMNDRTHFFDQGIGSPSPNNLVAAPPEHPHPHMDTSSRSQTVKDHIVALARLARQVWNIDVTVSSPASALSPDIRLASFGGQ